MIVTATEFKTNIGKYLAIVDSEDILITKNGKGVAKLTNFKEGRMDAVRSLRGVLKGHADPNITIKHIREERLAKYHDEHSD